MCIIFTHDDDARVDRDQFYTLWGMNPDGGGIMSITPDGVMRVRRAMGVDSVWRWYRQAVERGDSAIAVHMRIATHGVVNRSNTHPFRIGRDTWMMHNGIIPVYQSRGDKRSDTRAFGEDILSKLHLSWLDSWPTIDMVESFIGHSKLVIMSTNPKLMSDRYILNESLGTWHDGIWYSNTYGVCGVPKVRPIKSALWDDGAWLAARGDDVETASWLRIHPEYPSTE